MSHTGSGLTARSLSSARTADPASHSYALLVITVALGSTLAPLNSTMLAVALPEIRGAFHVSHGQIGWLVSAYLIAMAVAQPLGGRVGDQLGRARVFRAGLGAFFVLSIGAAFAPNFPMLILLRTGQALTGAAVIPNGMAMLRESVPFNRLGATIGLAGAATSIAAAVGPVLGAALLEYGNWRWIFLVNVPLVAVALATQAVLRYRDRGARTRLTFDWIGALAYVSLLAALTALLNGLRGGESGRVIAVAAAGFAVCSAMFWLRQRHGPLPIAEWRLFRNRSYATASCFILFSNLVMYTTLLTIPFFIREVQGKGESTTGRLLAAMSLMSAVVGLSAGWLSDAAGRRLPTMAGSLLTLLGVALMAVGLQRDAPFAFLAACLVLIGMGVGLSTGPASTAAVETAPRALAGAAAGANSMMRYLGSIVGAGVLGAVLSDAGGPPGIGVFRLVFVVLSVVAGLAAACTIFIHRFPGAELVIAPAAGGRSPVTARSAGERAAQSAEAASPSSLST